MDERKIRILNAIIHSYIASPIPVGSRKISKEYDLGVSSATIRNEMSDLEDLGYLNKPHSSAGRVPSDKAYRFYVDTWLQDPVVNPSKNMDKMVHFFEETNLSLEQLYKQTSEMLASLTDYAAYVMAPRKNDTILKHIELYPLDSDVILLLIIGNQGIVEKSLIRLSEGIPEDQLRTIRNQLNRGLTGINFSEINGLSLRVSGELMEYREFISKIVEVAYNVAKRLDRVDIYVNGITNLLKHEEYQDLEKARELLGFLEDGEHLMEVFPEVIGNGDIHIVIGQENPVEAMQENSIISAGYGIDKEKSGQVGLIGPVRMEYIPLIQLLGRVSQEMTKQLTKTL
ncbi:MAG: heat-inducible transcriptional repressor HrcA [Tissierellia bacterium]|nr:heat-inducible transcriptional repressor HrcA [Tissierellia bacterium]